MQDAHLLLHLGARLLGVLNHVDGLVAFVLDELVQLRALLELRRQVVAPLGQVEDRNVLDLHLLLRLLPMPDGLGVLAGLDVALARQLKRLALKGRLLLRQQVELVLELLVFPQQHRQLRRLVLLQRLLLWFR